MKMKNLVKSFILCLFLMVDNFLDVMTHYSYPIEKSSDLYSYTVYKNKKAESVSYNSETYTNYKDCIKVCYNKKSSCKSIEVKTLNDSNLLCGFLNTDSPTTYSADGSLFISSKQPNCSQSCNLTLNPCGMCKCVPSCSARNRRQHICDCSGAARIANSCQEHYDNGFNKTAVFLISLNGGEFKTLCEMEKFERQNPVINQENCSRQQNVKKKSNTFLEGQLNFTESYCFQWCVNKKNDDHQIDTLLFSKTNCSCVNAYETGKGNSGAHTFEGTYCKLSSSDCSLQNSKAGEKLKYYSENQYTVPVSFEDCWSSCKVYQQLNPTSNGYVASGVDATLKCECLYGYNEINDFQNGCLFETILPMQMQLNTKGIWMPMMTRFASWDSSFWEKSFESYENGFGLVNQQWIGLKKLNQITNAFVTDMRVDYTFKEDLTFSTMYYNISVSSKSNGYLLSYSAYDSRGSNEPDWFNANGMVFQSCKNWWATACNDTALFPTSISYISYGKTEHLESIQFLLRTNYTKQT